jgi:hypothetical protein
VLDASLSVDMGHVLIISHVSVYLELLAAIPLSTSYGLRHVASQTRERKRASAKCAGLRWSGLVCYSMVAGSTRVLFNVSVAYVLSTCALTNI